MIGISSLSQYFPRPNMPIQIDDFTFRLLVQEDESTFLINLKIKQKAVPGQHLIKFRFGIGRDTYQEDASHKTDRPHFEIETYRRGIETISTTVYFTFQDPKNEQIVRYAKGTIVFIERIVRHFLTKNKLSEELIDKLIYSDAVLDELAGFDNELVDALVESFENFDLIVRDGLGTPIKTTHRLKYYLSAPELEPFLQPLLKKIGK